MSFTNPRIYVVTGKDDNNWQSDDECLFRRGPKWRWQLLLFKVKKRRRINSPVKSTPVSRYPSPSPIPPRRLSESERPFYSLWIDGQRVINFFLFFLFLYFISLPFFFFLYGSREKGRSSLVSPPAIHIRTVYGTR